MRTAMCPKGAIDGTTVRGYRDELLREMGDPADALERMLIDRRRLAHVMTMQLHASTALGLTPEDGAGIYAAAAARLMAELRRTILSVREYRTPPATPHITTIEQQNVAECQEVTYVTTTTDGQDASMICQEKNERDGRLASNAGDQTEEAAQGIGGRLGGVLDEIPGPRGGRSPEPAVAGAAHGRGAASAPQGGPEE